MELSKIVKVELTKAEELIADMAAENIQNHKIKTNAFVKFEIEHNPLFMTRMYTRGVYAAGKYLGLEPEPSINAIDEDKGYDFKVGNITIRVKSRKLLKYNLIVSSDNSCNATLVILAIPIIKNNEFTNIVNLKGWIYKDLFDKVSQSAEFINNGKFVYDRYLDPMILLKSVVNDEKRRLK